MARTDRTRDDDKRHEDRAHDADLRRQDREREDQLRREADKTWERRRVAEELHARRSVAAGSQPVLELQAQELTESLAERKREADERHRAQAAQVFISVTTFPDNATGAALIEAMQ